MNKIEAEKQILEMTSLQQKLWVLRIEYRKKRCFREADNIKRVLEDMNIDVQALDYALSPLRNIDLC